MGKTEQESDVKETKIKFIGKVLAVDFVINFIVWPLLVILGLYLLLVFGFDFLWRRAAE